MYTWQIFTTFHNQSSLSMAFQVDRCRHHTPPVSGGPAVQSIHFKLHVAMVVGVGVTNVHTISLGCTYIYVSVWLCDDIQEMLNLKFGYGSKLLTPCLSWFLMVSYPKWPSLCVCIATPFWRPKAFGLHESDAMDFFVSWHGPRMSKALLEAQS